MTKITLKVNYCVNSILLTLYFYAQSTPSFSPKQYYQLVAVSVSSRQCFEIEFNSIISRLL